MTCDIMVESSKDQNQVTALKPKPPVLLPVAVVALGPDHDFLARALELDSLIKTIDIVAVVAVSSC